MKAPHLVFFKYYNYSVLDSLFVSPHTLSQGLKFYIYANTLRSITLFQTSL